MEIISFVITVVVGFIAASILGAGLNWPDAGAVFSIATIGSIILWVIRHNKTSQ